MHYVQPEIFTLFIPWLQRSVQIDTHGHGHHATMQTCYCQIIHGKRWWSSLMHLPYRFSWQQENIEDTTWTVWDSSCRDNMRLNVVINNELEVQEEIWRWYKFASCVNGMSAYWMALTEQIKGWKTELPIWKKKLAVHFCFSLKDLNYVPVILKKIQRLLLLFFALVYKDLNHVQESKTIWRFIKKITWTCAIIGIQHSIPLYCTLETNRPTPNIPNLTNIDKQVRWDADGWGVWQTGKTVNNTRRTLRFDVWIKMKQTDDNDGRCQVHSCLEWS